MNLQRLSHLILAVFLASSALAEVPEGLVTIPAGKFQQGLNSEAEKRSFGGPNLEEFKADRLPVREVTIAGFAIGKCEVTNQEFAAILNQALERDWITIDGNTVSNQTGDAKPLIELENPFCEIVFSSDRFEVNVEREKHPVVAVTWYGALFFAWAKNEIEALPQAVDLKSWAIDFSKPGFRLPTEAEWEFAARGGSAANWFPWGEQIEHSKANFFQSGDLFDDPFGLTASKGTTPVGYFDGTQQPTGKDMVSGYGLHDMAGNVMEWCADWYQINAYGGAPELPIDFKKYYREVEKIDAGSPVENPKGPETGEARVLRGGSWRMTENFLGCSMRFAGFPERADRGIGFRVALSLP